MPVHPPYRVGQRYRAIYATLQHVWPITTTQYPRGMRYIFALPDGWQGIYDVSGDRFSKFLTQLPVAPHPVVRITFTAGAVDSDGAIVIMRHPTLVRSHVI
jgi:hypothetical protein